MNDARVFIDENDRYSRLELIGWWDHQRLRRSHVMVVGAGALGNEVLKNLALVGLGRITIIDFDKIENSNLSRSVLFREHHSGQSKATVAAEAVRELNPDVCIDAIDGNVLTRIGLGLVRDADVVVGCLDNREARLWVNRMCWKVGTPWIDGGIQEINGVAKVFRPPAGACYECAMTENDYRLIQLRYSCPLLKQEDLQQGKVPTAPTIASIIAGLQVQETLKLLHDMSTADGCAMVFNGVANQFYQTKYQHREDCLSHETYDPIQATPLTNESSLRQVGEWVEQKMDASIEALVLDRDLVTNLTCAKCNVDEPRLRTLPEMDITEASCPECEQVMKPVMVHEIELNSDLASKPLRDVGIPAQDVIQVKSTDNVFFLELE